MTLLYVGYALAIAGLFGAGTAIALQLQRAINYKAANAQFIKLANARNLDRAIKLTHAASDKTYFRALRAAIVAGGRAQTTDTTALAPTMQTAFDEASRDGARMWRLYGVVGMVCSIVGVAGGALAVVGVGLHKHSPAEIPLGLAVICLFCGFGCVTKLGQLDAALADTRHQVLPALSQAFAAGATINPEEHGGA